MDKLWITRNRVKFSDEVHIHLSEPKCVKGMFYGDDMEIEFNIDSFKKVFKFTPKTGSCKEHELTLDV